MPVIFEANVEQLAAARSGLTVVVGLELRLNALSSGQAALSSGLDDLPYLDARHHGRSPAVPPAEDRCGPAAPPPARAVHFLPVTPGHPYDEHIVGATARRPGLIVVDRLGPDSAPAALAAARTGQLVLSQLDTVFRGGSVARHLLDLGAARGDLAGLAWVIAVQRLAMLCPHCKQPVPPDELARLRDTPSGSGLPEGATFHAGRCARCDHRAARRRHPVRLLPGQHPAPACSTRPASFRWPGTRSTWRRWALALDDVLHFDAEQCAAPIICSLPASRRW